MAKKKQRMPRPDPPGAETWQEKWELAVSTIDFQKRLYAASDALMLEMIRGGGDLAFTQFPTATAKRPVMVIVGIGKEVCETLRSLMEMIQDGE
jgi:hypothetical protein